MRTFAATLFVLTTAASTAFSQTQTIDFHQFAGPSVFSGVGAPLQVDSATISGGQILTNATSLPANAGTVYGTASFCPGCLPTITIAFAQGVSKFSVFVMNGNTVTVTYTVLDDQGGSQLITLVANFLSGAGTVTLPESNIHNVQITSGEALGGCCGWDFLIDYITFAPAAPVLVDPVPNTVCTGACLLTGSTVTTNTDLLATQGTVVQNVAADGVTQVVLRIPAATVGQQLTLDISPASSGLGGMIAAVGQSFGAGPITVTAVDTPSGPMAFALYKAPTDFSEYGSDDTASQRAVSVQIQPIGSTTTTTATITILRPPVVLIHGLWDSSGAWGNFTTLTADARFFVRAVDYSTPLTGITATSPTYTSTQLAQATASALGFAYNAPGVLQQIDQYISEFKTANNAAAVQAALVAHSMGGDIARTLRSVPSFASGINFDEGTVHKLVTIGTPHLGSPLAIQLLQANNACVAGLLASNGSIAFSTVTFSSRTVTGGVGDLRGNGTGGMLSPALGSMQASFVTSFPTALIAGAMTSANLNGINCFFGKIYGLCAAQAIRTKCPSSSPLAANLTSGGWPTVLGGSSDAVVPVTSQLNNTVATSAGMQVNGVIHSVGMEQLDFGAPAELDSASGIAAQVIVLLNEIVSGVDFHSL